MPATFVSDALQLAAGAEIHQHQPAVVGHHDVLRFDIAVQEAGRVDRRHRAAQLDADPCDLRRRKRRALAERLFERAALDELHPQADASVDAFSAVDGDDVRMADAGEEPAFFDDRGRGPLGDVGRQQLQRDLAIQPGVPGAIDVAERAAPDAFEHAQVTPVSPAARGRRVRGRATEPQRGQRLELLDNGLVCRVGARFDDVPVHGVPSRIAPATSSRSASRLHVFISSARRSSARCAALRAASGVGLPSISASSAYE